MYSLRGFVLLKFQDIVDACREYLIVYLQSQQLPVAGEGRIFAKEMLVCQKISYAAYLLLMP